MEYNSIAGLHETRGRIAGKLYKKDSHSESSTSNETTNIDNRIGAGDGSVIATDGANIVVQRLDADVAKAALASNRDVSLAAIDKSLDFGEKVLDDAADIVIESIDFADETFESSLEFADSATDKSQEVVKEVVERFADTVEAQEKTESKQIFQIGIVAIAAVTVIFVTKFLKKR